MSELIERLFESWKWKPDAISVDEIEEDPVIVVEWLFENKAKHYGFTPVRWDTLWRMFNEYWVQYGGVEDLSEGGER